MVLATPNKAKSSHSLSTPHNAATKSNGKLKSSVKSAKKSDDEIPAVNKSSKKQKPQPEEEEDEDISLFHPSTAVQAAADTTQDDDDADEAIAEAESDSEADPLTSSTFLDQLLNQQTPQLLHVLEEIKNKIAEIRTQTLKPLLREAKTKAMPTQEGMSFLELKNHLLLQYLQHVVLFILCKTSSDNKSSKKNSPSSAAASEERLRGVVKQLIYLRTVMEKLKPLDKKLKYQVDKMLKMASHMNKAGAEDQEEEEEETSKSKGEEDGDEEGMGGDDDGERRLEDEGYTNHMNTAASAMPSASSSGEDPLSFRPNPQALLAAMEGGGTAGAAAGKRGMAARGGADDSGAGEIYRPPRLHATAMEDTEREQDRRNKALRRAQERASSSAYLKSVRSELSERPEEMTIDLDDARPDEEEMERRDFEERNMLRLSDTRKDKARKKEKARAAKNTLLGLEGGEFDDFRDMERGMSSFMQNDLRPDQMDDLAAEAMSSRGQKRKGGRGNEDDHYGDFEFDDPAESRFAKKRKGPNGKNSFSSKFKGKSKGGRR